jgi:hypothetical protein
MNPLGHRILEVLQASPDGHSTAFNVLNRDGYNVTKHEFEEACKKLYDCTCVTYRPIRSSLIDFPNRNPLSTDQLSGAVCVFRGCRPGARYRDLSEDLAAQSSPIEEIRYPVESEMQPT